MKKKYLISMLVLFLGILSFTGIVKATNNDVSDRDMAIACALSYVPLQENKTMAECFDTESVHFVSKIVNFVNSKFNLHDYATIHELDDWTVVNYHNKEFSEKSLAAFVLKNGNDLIIVFRGTDMEALADVRYGLKNYHDQEQYAENYVIEILNEYATKGEKYNIYVAGHSLGGYLAQTAGSALYRKIESDTSTYKNINFERIVDFNGIGINFLTYFGEKNNYGNQAQNIETLKELGNKEKLIEYYTYGDLVSSLGVHYGEMRMLLPSIDSITYHRSNYQILSNLNQRIGLSKKLNTILDKDKYNAFKTDIAEAKDLYKLGGTVVGYLNLTHEADAFASIDLDKSENEPSVKIIKDTGTLSSHLAKSASFIQSTQSITLKALTSYASVKKYEWYVSDNKKSWKLVKTVDLYNPNDEAPTNTLDIDINSIPTGKSKYYKVVSYYNDNYTSSKYYYNEAKKEYEYRETNNSKNEEYKPVTAIVEVKHKKPVNSLLKILLNKLLSYKK